MGDGNARTGRLKLGLQIAAACVVVLIGAFAVGSAVAGPFFWYSCSLDGLEAHGAAQREHPRVPRRHAARAARRERGSPTRRAAAGQPGDAEGDHRHRGPPLLRDERDRLHRDRAGAEERRLGRRVRAGRLDDRAAARPQPLPHPAAVDQPESSPRPALPSSSTSNGARTASSPPTSTTSTSARRRTGSRPPPTRTSGCTRRTSRSSRRRCSRGCRRRPRRTTRSTGRTPRRPAGRRSYGRCSAPATYPRPAIDEPSTARSA